MLQNNLQAARSCQKPSPQASNTQAYDAILPFPLLETVPKQPVGLGIRTSEQGITHIDYIDRPRYRAPQNALAMEAARQLQCYFDNPQWQFSLPLDLQGTVFQLRLWRALCGIPAGTIDTYGEMARGLHSGAQAVGQACRRNPVPVIIPCHRVLSAHGAGGYAGQVEGQKMKIKLALLQHESVAPGRPRQKN